MRQDIMNEQVNIFLVVSPFRFSIFCSLCANDRADDNLQPRGMVRSSFLNPSFNQGLRSFTSVVIFSYCGQRSVREVNFGGVLWSCDIPPFQSRLGFHAGIPLFIVYLRSAT